MRPTRELGRAAQCAPCLALLRAGFAEPDRSPDPLVSSYLTLSPLPARRGRAPARRRSALCGTVRRLPCLGVTQRPALWGPDFPRGGARRHPPRPPGRLLFFASSIRKARSRSALSALAFLEQPGRGAGRDVIGTLGGQPLVDGLVGQPVGLLVELPGHVLETKRPELAEQAPGLLV